MFQFTAINGTHGKQPHRGYEDPYQPQSQMKPSSQARPNSPPTNTQQKDSQQLTAQAMENQDVKRAASSGDEEDQDMRGGDGSDRLPALKIKPDHTKWRRNSSKRSKTGCITCKRRKKKCDESRPECNNCIRGGFVCSPCPISGQRLTTAQNQAPLPLRSKDEKVGGQYRHTPSTSNINTLQLPPISSIYTPPSTNLQKTAQSAIYLTATMNWPRTQKEEMLAGRHYFPFDQELALERERCSAACWRFNNSTNPNHGISPKERTRQFQDILQPKQPIKRSLALALPFSPSGFVGQNVVVEAPFTCHYGYNIHIGQDVAIGKGCTILDSCEVRIGDRCTVGPNVQIYTATLPVDSRQRLGSQGPNLGRPVTIESDSCIGGGAIILPGLIIKRGSTVGAGSIVTRDVPAFSVVCGNPARVISITETEFEKP